MTHRSPHIASHRFTSGVLALAAGFLLGSCAPVTNLLSPAGPRFEGHYAPVPARGPPPSFQLRLVTFNIRYAREIERAIEVLRDDSLRTADVVTLQEMDETGVDRVARALDFDYAYFPSSIHPVSGQYFGPAVLSRWPIERSWKVLLPHGGWTRGQRRTATAAVLRIGNTRLLVYAVHLETPVQVSERARRDQVGAVIADAADHRGPVVIAGDFNSREIGHVLTGRGYTWLTQRIGATISWFSWDHIFVRGLSPATPASAGVLEDVRGASDHHPVWAVVNPPSSGPVAARPQPSAP